mgnify:CR=1 FL=1
METLWAYADYTDNIHFSEDMIRFIAKKVGKQKINYDGKEIDIATPWKKMSMVEALKSVIKIDAEKKNLDELKELLNKHKITHEKGITWGLAVHLLFEELVESQLIQPTIIYNYPVETSPLAKAGKDPRFVERFESFINGWEIGNSYSELNDPEILRDNWKNQESRAKKGDEEAQKMDHEFLQALEIGMPPTSGLGIGVDRLVMLLTGSLSIKDVIFFPFMKLVE